MADNTQVDTHESCAVTNNETGKWILDTRFFSSAFIATTCVLCMFEGKMKRFMRAKAFGLSVQVSKIRPQRSGYVYTLLA